MIYFLVRSDAWQSYNSFQLLGFFTNKKLAVDAYQKLLKSLSSDENGALYATKKNVFDFESEIYYNSDKILCSEN